METNGSPDSDEFYDQLRLLVVSEPKDARAAVARLLQEGSAPLAEVLQRASRPGEGRIRQVIAMSARLSQTAGEIEPCLRSWASVEPDEFTRGAISSALDSIRPSPLKPSRKFEMPEHFVDAYRYASERLCHRVRNPLTKASALLLRMQQAIGNTSDSNLRGALTGLYSDLQSLVQRVGSVVEFDIDEPHTEWRAIALGEWLKATAKHFAARFGPARLLVRGSADAISTSVRANFFLLETVFGNIWSNAVQASEESDGKECRITAELMIKDCLLEVLLRDDGPGFSEHQVETAFLAPFSTKAAERGRGLLEISEAIGRLQGTVSLVKVPSGEYRMHIRLPTDNS